MNPKESCLGAGFEQVRRSIGRQLPLHNLSLLFILATTAGCATVPTTQSSIPGRSAADPMFGFQGTWEGALDGYGGAEFVDATGHSRSYRLVIDSAGKAKAYDLVDGSWSESKPGTYRSAIWASQALVRSTTSGVDEDGTWVETWAFTLVHIDAETVAAYALRTVNNLDLPPSDEYYHFAWGFSGKMHRVSTGK